MHCFRKLASLLIFYLMLFFHFGLVYFSVALTFIPRLEYLSFCSVIGDRGVF